MDTSTFEAERRRLTAIAVRIIGSRSDADDIVQEAWLRLSRAEGIDNLPAWLTTVVTRLCLDHLRKRHLAPAIVEKPLADPAQADPETDALLAEKVGEAMRVVLDALAPAERATFVLHDIFGYSFDEISEIMGRSGTAVRQLASRARRKVQGTPEPAESTVVRAHDGDVVRAFMTAAHGGDLATLLTLLAPGAVMRADLVGQRMGTNPEYDGASAVAARFNGTRGAAAVTIDGDLGAAWFQTGMVKVAFVFHLEAGLIHEIELIADPEVLSTLDVLRVRTKSGGVDIH